MLARTVRVSVPSIWLCASSALFACSSQAPPNARAESGASGVMSSGGSGASAGAAAGERGGGMATDAAAAGASAGGAGASSGGAGAGASASGAGAGAGGTAADGGSDAGRAGEPATPPEAPELKPCEPVPSGEQLAFPGAEGFGRFARGGRGGDVCHVTTLADSGAGSLRDCVSRGDRTVVFEVGGWITLASNLGITVDRLTIAGQTAPGGGIGVRGRKLSIGGDDIILRFLRVRHGTIATTDRNDAMAVSSAASNVIVDHCSIGFGTDENFSMPGDEGVGPRDFTVQWSVIAWGLQRNNHSAGSLLTASNTTIHHSIYAFSGTRNPKARSEDGRPLDFVNNVIYGWNAPDPVGEAQGWSISKQPFLLADSANGTHNANAVGNYFISHGTQTAAQAFVSGRANEAGEPTFNLYFEDNLLDGNANQRLDASKDDWTMVGTATRRAERLTAPKVCTDAAPMAFERVMEQAGATRPMRDEVDAALVSAIRAQGGKKIQDEHDLGVGADGYGALAAGIAPPDTDRDGMADAWETARGLDAAKPDDRNADDDSDGYTNLEEYLNELAAPAFR